MKTIETTIKIEERMRLAWVRSNRVEYFDVDDPEHVEAVRTVLEDPEIYELKQKAARLAEALTTVECERNTVGASRNSLQIALAQTEAERDGAQAKIYRLEAEISALKVDRTALIRKCAEAAFEAVTATWHVDNKPYAAKAAVLRAGGIEP